MVFGRRAGVGASQYVKSLSSKPKVSEQIVEQALNKALAPFKGNSDENPYAVHQELQQVMNDLVGIIRDGDEMLDAISKLEDLKKRAKKVTVQGERQFNPGWHLSLDLENMLLVSESIAKSALVREESRGGHTRNDFPNMDKNWRPKHVITSWNGSSIDTKIEAIPPMPKELADLFGEEELSKYLLPEELVQLGMGA